MGENEDKPTAAEPGAKARKSQPVITVATSFEPGETVAGRYRIVSMIAHGGMGDVYEAMDTELRTEVALKTIRGAPSGPRVERFRREIFLARKVTHPNVSRVFDLGRHETANGGEIVFITMELLRGDTLSARIKKEGRLTPRQALPIIRQIAVAMDAAHAVGVVHRDLKPGNVMLVDDDANGSPRAIVTDFGIAHGTGDPFDDLSGTGDVVGSPAYMAPEQIEGDETTPRTDVYAFGLVIFEMVTGVRPFQGETSISAVVKRLKVAPQKPTVHAPDLSPEWEATIMRCLERDPKQRFASGQEIVDALTGGPTAPVARIDPADIADSANTAVAPPHAVSAQARRRWVAAGALAVAVVGGSAFVLTRGNSNAPTVPAAPAVGPVAKATTPIPAQDKAQAISIAVLPFADTSPKKDQEWLSEGFSEELLVHLAKIKELRVLGRSSAAAFKNATEGGAEIAKKLGVTNLVEGSVAKIDDRIRITARLINPSDGTQLWAESFDRNGKDVFAIQAEIASAVANALEVKLVTPPAVIARTANPAAYEQLLRGRLFSRRDGKDELEQGVAAYQAAIDLDPTYAEAYAGLAFVLSYLADYAATPEARQTSIDRAHALARKAVALGPGVAAAHRVLAHLAFSFDWEWDAAKASLERALELEPRNPDTLRLAGRLAGAVGDNARAASLAAQAVEIEPLVAPSWNEVGIQHAAVGELAEARKAISHALELNPKSTFAKNRLGVLDLLENKPDAALARAESITVPGFKLTLTAMAEHTRGHREASKAALDKLIETEAHTFAYQIASVFAWRGELDNSFSWLDKALALRDGGLQEVRSDRVFTKLRTDPRFNAFLLKMKLPPLWP